MSEDRYLREALRRRWPLDGHADTREALLSAYGDPRRGYHDLMHLADVLEALDVLAATEDFAHETVRLAAWFHDGVYEGDRLDEQRSAEWARRALAPYEGTAEVARLVGLTAEHRPGPGDVDGAALCDADLAILASPARRYAAYVAGVRREYARYPLRDFCAGRARVLRDLLAGGPLFHTDTGRERWEGPARGNLSLELRVLDELAGPGSG